MHISYSDGSIVEGTVVYPNLISGISLERLPTDLSELEQALNSTEMESIRTESFCFDGIGADAWEDTLTIDWYSRITDDMVR